MTQRAFKNVRGAGAECSKALPVDKFMRSLEALQTDIATEKNRVWQRVADGTLSLELLQRLCKEYYFLGKWYTCEFGSIVSNAPDVDAVTSRRQRALPALGAEPRRRDRLRRRSQSCRHESRLGARARHQRR